MYQSHKAFKDTRKHSGENIPTISFNGFSFSAELKFKFVYCRKDIKMNEINRNNSSTFFLPTPKNTDVRTSRLMSQLINIAYKTTPLRDYIAQGHLK